MDHDYVFQRFRYLLMVSWVFFFKLFVVYLFILAEAMTGERDLMIVAIEFFARDQSKFVRYGGIVVETTDDKIC